MGCKRAHCVRWLELIVFLDPLSVVGRCRTGTWSSLGFIRGGGQRLEVVLLDHAVAERFYPRSLGIPPARGEHRTVGRAGRQALTCRLSPDFVSQYSRATGAASQEDHWQQRPQVGWRIATGRHDRQGYRHHDALAAIRVEFYAAHRFPSQPIHRQ
jgi:hypothetical protein